MDKFQTRSRHLGVSRLLVILALGFLARKARADECEKDHYHGLDLARAAKEQWGDKATITRKGGHLYDWAANSNGAANALDLKRAVADQYGSDWSLVYGGVGAFDWKAVRFDKLPKAVLPVVLIASDRFYEVDKVAQGTRCFASSILGVRDWYRLRAGRTFRVLQPIVVLSKRKSDEWDDLSRRTDKGNDRFILLEECIKEYKQHFPDPGGRFKVALVPFTGEKAKVWLGAASLGDYAVVAPINTSVLCPPLGKPGRHASSAMYGIGHELGHTFGLKHTSEIYPDNPDAFKSIMQSAQPPDAILLPKEIDVLRASEFFAQAPPKGAPLNDEAKEIVAKLEQALKTVDLSWPNAYEFVVRRSGYGIRKSIGVKRDKFIINKEFIIYEVHFSERKIIYFGPPKD